MTESADLTPRGRLLIGALSVAAGIVPMLAAFDIGPLGVADINGPPWLGLTAGGIFVAGGIAVALGDKAQLLVSVLAVLILAGLAAIGSWIAFGAGERNCSGSFSFPVFWGDADLSGLACRIPFGLGAMMLVGPLVYGCCATLQKALGGPPRLNWMLTVAKAVVVLSFAPIIVLLVLTMGLQVGFAAVRTRVATGAWPRNEDFIRRQREKGLLGRYKPRKPGS